MPKLQLPSIHLRFWRKSKNDVDTRELGLDKVLQSVTDDIRKSRKRLQDSGKEGVLFLDKAQITISFIAKRTLSGDVKLLAADASGTYSAEQMHQVTLELSTIPPLVAKLVENAASKRKMSEDVQKTIDTLLDETLSQESVEIMRRLRQPEGE